MPFGITPAAEVAELENGGMLYFLRRAFDKLMREIPRTKVREGETVIW